MDPVESPASALARVVVARRDQLAFRVGLAVAVAVICHALIGWQTVLLWLAAYMPSRWASTGHFMTCTPPPISRPDGGALS